MFGIDVLSSAIQRRLQLIFIPIGVTAIEDDVVRAVCERKDLANQTLGTCDSFGHGYRNITFEINGMRGFSRRSGGLIG